MNIPEYLLEHGVKPSYSRVRIFDYIFTNKNHPTVDMIYAELSKEIPTLSRTTVYNTVNLFNEKGLVNKMGIDEQETRYDADVSVHAHFRCDSCGKIMDLMTEGDLPKITGPEQVNIREIQYYVKGLCQQCQN